MKRYIERSDALMDFALAGARDKLQSILRLFPELRAEITNDSAPPAAAPAPLTGKQKRLKTHALEHWHSTNGSASVKGLSLAAALRKVLSDEPRTSLELQGLLRSHGYVYKGKAGLSSRVPQELLAMMKQGKAKRITVKQTGRNRFAWTQQAKEGG